MTIQGETSAPPHDGAPNEREDENTIEPVEPVESTEPAETPEDEPQKENKQSFMEAARSKRLRPFVIISVSYLLFTITDGAIRMIVLLHAYNKNFSALQVAVMFTLYELAGVVTNLAAGLMGARWGIRFTLIFGLILQLLSYGLLFGWQDDWSQTSAIIYVTVRWLENVWALTLVHCLTRLGYLIWFVSREYRWHRCLPVLPKT